MSATRGPSGQRTPAAKISEHLARAREALATPSSRQQESQRARKRPRTEYRRDLHDKLMILATVAASFNAESADAAAQESNMVEVQQVHYSPAKHGEFSTAGASQDTHAIPSSTAWVHSTSGLQPFGILSSATSGQAFLKGQLPMQPMESQYQPGQITTRLMSNQTPVLLAPSSQQVTASTHGSLQLYGQPYTSYSRMPGGLPASTCMPAASTQATATGMLSPLVLQTTQQFVTQKLHQLQQLHDSQRSSFMPQAVGDVSYRAQQQQPHIVTRGPGVQYVVMQQQASGMPLLVPVVY